MQTPFVDPGLCNNSQLAFLTLVYAIVLYQASQYISDGSELLMLIPSVAGLVGSIVLPILGAVPDGMMVLFSGLGPNAQETVAVGVGALAGSTVMLLTFPWFICILFGRVPFVNDRPNWTDKSASPDLCKSGISFHASLQTSCKIMLATTLLYALIQVPATFQEALGKSTKSQGRSEHGVALAGLVACGLAFFGYLFYCFWDANEDKQLAEVIKGIERKQISIAAALEFIDKTTKQTDGDKESPLVRTEQMERVRKICRPFFNRYDYNKDRQLSLAEMPPLLHDLGIPMHVTQLMKEQDTNDDGEVSFDEFTTYLYKFMNDPKKMEKAVKFSNPCLMRKVDSHCEDDEEDVMPDDIAMCAPEKQMRLVVLRSVWMMALGTALVLVFSDPMVDCLSEWGNRLGVSAFYVSFVLAPFASNASELLAAYTYARKKTEKNLTTSLSTLVGAACMNNTFVLGIFLALIYLQGLAWQFTAETIAMVLIQWIIGLLALWSKRQKMWKAVIILLCYPGCLAIVWFLENKVGLD